jgi:hypothetical protein
MVHVAIKVERQCKRKETLLFQNPGSYTSRRSNGRKDNGAVLKSKTELPKWMDEVPDVHKGKTETQARNCDIKVLSLFGSSSHSFTLAK